MLGDQRGHVLTWLLQAHEDHAAVDVFSDDLGLNLYHVILLLHSVVRHDGPRYVLLAS